ncbi:MAG: FmdE family protein [Smithella sp.]
MFNEQKDNDQYAALLAEAGRFHGDVCAGIEIGTRMTMCALRKLGIVDPKGADRKKLMVFVEIDRCATDAIMALTGCRPGKRTMKVLDYGKMAATFVNLESKKAVRVALQRKKEAGEESRDNQNLANLSEDELFSVTEVEVPLRPEDMPGKPLRRCRCARCGENIMDGREFEEQGETLCKPCFERKNYYHITA